MVAAIVPYWAGALETNATEVLPVAACAGQRIHPLVGQDILLHDGPTLEIVRPQRSQQRWIVHSLEQYREPWVDHHAHPAASPVPI